MNRIKQLKDKYDTHLPQLAIAAGGFAVTVSLAAAVYYKQQLSEFDGAKAVLDVSRTEDGKVVLALADGYAMAILFENLPISNFIAFAKA